MARNHIRIYGSNGELRYDSDRRDVEGTDDSIRAQFDSGLLWYHDPDEGVLRCQTKARTSMPEQFVVDFETTRGSRSDSVEAFRSAIDDAFAELDWEYIPSNRKSDIQVIIEKMGKVGAKRPPTYEEALLKRLLEQGTGVTFAVPSKEESIAVAEYFRGLDSNISIAISQSGRTDAVPDADVVLVPSDDYPSITGIDGTDAALREAETNAYIESVTNTIERAVDPAKAGTASQIATLLNRSGLRKQGITAVPNRQNKQQGRQAFVWPLLAASVLLFVGLFVLLAEPMAFVTGLADSSQVDIAIDLGVWQPVAIPLWSILLMMSVGYGISALLLWQMGILKLPSTSTGRRSKSQKDASTLPREMLQGADGILDGHADEHINWGEVTSRLHRQYPQVLIKRKSAYDRKLRISALLGLAVGVVAGLTAGIGTALAYDWLSQRPIAVLNAVWFAGFAVPVGFFVYLNYRVLKSFSPSRGRRRRSSMGRRRGSRGPGKILFVFLAALLVISVSIIGVVFWAL